MHWLDATMPNPHSLSVILRVSSDRSSQINNVSVHSIAITLYTIRLNINLPGKLSSSGILSYDPLDAA